MLRSARRVRCTADQAENAISTFSRLATSKRAAGHVHRCPERAPGVTAPGRRKAPRLVEAELRTSSDKGLTLGRLGPQPPAGELSIGRLQVRDSDLEPAIRIHRREYETPGVVDLTAEPTRREQRLVNQRLSRRHLWASLALGESDFLGSSWVRSGCAGLSSFTIHPRARGLVKRCVTTSDGPVSSGLVHMSQQLGGGDNPVPARRQDRRARGRPSLRRTIGVKRPDGLGWGGTGTHRRDRRLQTTPRLLSARRGGV
jgi:hypothetical protein